MSTSKRVTQIALGTLLATSGIVFAAVLGPERLAEAKATHQWTPVGATVVDAVAEHHTRRKGRSSWEVTVSYEYEVAGTRHVGTRWTAAGDRSVRTRDEAEALMAQHPIGTALTVLVDPDDATHAVVEAGGEDDAWFMIGLGVLFAGAGVFTAWRGWRRGVRGGGEKDAPLASE